MLSNEVKSRLENEVMDVLNEHNLSYNIQEIENLVDRWYANKKPLIDNLSNHENWDAEAFAVIQKIDIIREIDVKVVNQSINNMLNYAKSNKINFNYNDYNIIFALMNSPSQFVGEGLKTTLSHYCYKANTGQKVSRILNELFIKNGLNKKTGHLTKLLSEKEGLEKTKDDFTTEEYFKLLGDIKKEIAENDYNKLFAKVSDAFSPQKVMRTCILSVHPCDYLHMSYGVKSCHNLYDGEYKAGTLSNMYDEVTTVFYTLKSDVTSGYHNEKKITRNLFYYEGSVLIQSRLYPADNGPTRSQYMDIVKGILGNSHKLGGKWEKHSPSKIHMFCRTHENGLHYADYNTTSYVSISVQQGAEQEYRLTIGNTSYCLECGGEITDPAHLHCGYCANYRYDCAGCGNVADEDECHYINYDYYCNDCVDYCEECHEYVLSDDMSHVRDIDRYVCNECVRDGDFFYCDECEKYHTIDEQYYICDDQTNLCSGCYDDAECFQCGECCENFSKQQDNDGFCLDCYEDMEEPV